MSIEEYQDFTSVYMQGFCNGEGKWKHRIIAMIKNLQDNNNGDDYSLENVVGILKKLLED